MRVFRILFLVWIFPFPVCAQEGDKIGNWLMYFGTNRISDKFSIHTEAQFRNHTGLPIHLEQLLLRAGLNYHFAPNAMVTAGYGYISNYVYESEQSAPEVEEHRIWQQLLMTHNIGRVKFEHRYRIEQRWVENEYRNRFRYRLMGFVPLNKPVIEPGSVFIGLYDEIFINSEERFFDRNRFYAAVGYQFNQSTSLQAGMMNQRVTDFGKWYLQFALFFNPDLRKSDTP